MKKVFFTIIIGFISMSAYSQISFGGGLTYDIGDNFGVKVLGNGDFNDEWAGQVSFSYFFSDWAIDLDAQYKLIEFETGYEEGYLIPFAGININRDNSEVEDKTDIGINIGLNLSLPIEGYKLFLEPKLTFGGIGGIIISAGIMF